MFAIIQNEIVLIVTRVKPCDDALKKTDVICIETAEDVKVGYRYIAGEFKHGEIETIVTEKIVKGFDSFTKEELISYLQDTLRNFY